MSTENNYRVAFGLWDHKECRFDDFCNSEMQSMYELEALKLIEIAAYEQLKKENSELAQSELECRQLYNEFVGDLNTARIKSVQLELEIEQLKKENADIVIQRDRYIRDFQNNYKWRINQAADIEQLKSKLKVAVEYIQNETRCEKEPLLLKNNFVFVHVDDCRKCKFLKEIGEI